MQNVFVYECCVFMCIAHWDCEEQSSLQQRGDEEKALQLSKIHEKRLAEIKAYNQQLEKEREGEFLGWQGTTSNNVK